MELPACMHACIHGCTVSVKGEEGGRGQIQGTRGELQVHKSSGKIVRLLIATLHVGMTRKQDIKSYPPRYVVLCLHCLLCYSPCVHKQVPGCTVAVAIVILLACSCKLLVETNLLMLLAKL